MRSKALFCVVIALLVSACSNGSADETTSTSGPERATTTTETSQSAATTMPAQDAELGSSDRPIQILFVPSVDAEQIVSDGEVLDEALTDATGLEFEVNVPTSYAATVEAMCAAPAETMGFIPGFGYVLASNLCGVDVAFKAVRFGWPNSWSQILVRRDSDIQTLSDLDGLSWAVPDLASTSGYLIPSVQIDEAGVEADQIVETGGHPNAALALYRGEADFATTFFSPPLTDPAWTEDDPPQVPEDLVDQCAPNEDGELLCGPGYEVRDARRLGATEAPDIIQVLRILEISPPIPNDTLSFGPDFPESIRTQIEDALVEFVAECDTDENCAFNNSIGNSYAWTGIEPATDSEYDPLRVVVESAGITLDDL